MKTHIRFKDHKNSTPKHKANAVLKASFNNNNAFITLGDSAAESEQIAVISVIKSVCLPLMHRFVVMDVDRAIQPQPVANICRYGLILESAQRLIPYVHSRCVYNYVLMNLL